MDAGLLPVKSLGRAKARLASHFNPPERVEIATALFEDALELCESVPWLTWWVVSDDESVLDVARTHGLDVVADGGNGLNRALSLAIGEVIRAGAASVTVIPCDVPLAYSEDLRDLSDTGATSDVVVVPSEGDGGTNGLWLSPPNLLEPRFGPGSLNAHVNAARELGLRCSILPLPRLSLDIDTVEDADEFLTRPVRGQSRTRDVLARLRPLPV